MKIVVDCREDIAQLFKLISESIRESKQDALCILENYIVISAENAKVKKIIGEVLAEYIINKFEKGLLLGYIKEFELLPSDVEQVVSTIATADELKEKRLKILRKEIMLQLSSGHINVDGLVAFRLSEYKEELKFAAEFFIDELSVKKSYDEFIGLMKYFAEIQAPVTDMVVLTESMGEYKLTDSSGEQISLSFDEEFAEEISPIGLTSEDLLISNLMAAMPKKIIFKDINEEKPIINTISRIFEGRISY
ncbi:MAG: putative sporulation protein YtxC [Monoglobales bacterium]